MSFTSAKEFELVARQNDAWRTEGIGDFLKGEYKPGLESHDRKRA
jgi:trans-feruloyl-CoA hydratase/vanillin synthase